MKALNWADWVLMAIVLGSTLVGVRRGLAKEILSLLKWFVALVLVLIFSEKLALLLVNWIETPSLRIAVAMLILFAATMVVGDMLIHLISDLFKKTGLTGTDRMFGSLFGFARGFVVVMFVVIAGKSYFMQDAWWQQSLLVPHFVAMESWSLRVWSATTAFINQLISSF